MKASTRAAAMLALAMVLPPTWRDTRPAEAAERRCFGRAATIVGTDGRDEITVRSGTEVIVGLGGNDLIRVGRAGDFYVCAGGGEDTVITGRARNHVRGGGGNDRLISRTDYEELPANRFFGGSGDDRLVGSSGRDHMIPGPGNDYITDEGTDPYKPDTLDLSSAERGVRVSFERHTIRGQGRDTFFRMERVIGSSHDDALIGDEDPEWFFAGAGSDSLDGGGGDDYLTGGPGGDDVSGGNGNDFIYEGVAHEAPERSDDRLDGGAGYDWVSYEDPFTDVSSGVHLDLRTGRASAVNGEDTLAGIEGAIGTSADDVLLGDEGDNNFLDLIGRDEVRGNGGDDVLGEFNDTAAASGWVVVSPESEGDDVLDGGDGRDRIDGGPGSDSLIGGDGDDTIEAADSQYWAGRSDGYSDDVDGGAGRDEISYEHSEGAVVVDLLAGFAEDREGTDTIVAIEDVRGSLYYADRLTGDQGDNSLYGERGDDILDGGDGFDRLFGGDDEDTCVNGEQTTDCER